MSYQKTISDLSYKVIIPNWFTKNQLEELTNKNIPKGVYQEFLFYVQKSYLMDDISESIRGLYGDFEKTREAVK